MWTTPYVQIHLNTLIALVELWSQKSDAVLSTTFSMETVLNEVLIHIFRQVLEQPQ